MILQFAGIQHWKAPNAQVTLVIIGLLVQPTSMFVQSFVFISPVQTFKMWNCSIYLLQN